MSHNFSKIETDKSIINGTKKNIFFEKVNATKYKYKYYVTSKL